MMTPRSGASIRRNPSPSTGWLSLLLLSLSLPSLHADSTVVFNEIMYHPATSEPVLEWVELHNQNAVDVDLAGWYFSEGISYTFPEGTILRGGACLVVAVSPPDLTAATGITNVVGPYSGRLANNGETLTLRDLKHRLMDSVAYGIDDDWPAGPDGSGVSLAKKAPDLGSAPPASWTASTQIGGTPGQPNFTDIVLTGAESNVIEFTSTWRYHDLGVDLGSSWRDPGFDDSTWTAAPALFFFGEAPLPAPRNTTLTPNHTTYYFRTTFQFSGTPGLTLLSFRPIFDDGAIVYLNGSEIARHNMPAGTIGFNTQAQSGVGTASILGPISLPAGGLIPGQNLIAVELHQNGSTSDPGLNVITPAAYTAGWDGADGGFSSASNPAPAPPNDALASRGVDALPSSNTAGAANLTDGFYGDDSSWTPDPSDANPYIVLRFNQTIPISGIAWSRDNGNAADAGCGGTCTDHALGNYTFQYTLVADPPSVLNNSANPNLAWTTIATVQHLNTTPGFTPHLRHSYSFSAVSGTPMMATGIRLRLPVGATIDEIEINPPAQGGFDAAFGMELVATDILPPPPALVLNEISAASSTNFWIEIINAGPAPAQLAGVRLVRSGNGSPSFDFPDQSLDPGALLSLNPAALGFGADAGQILSLYASDGFALLDAATVRAQSRGRAPDASGDWMNPSLPTPGTSNVFNLRDDIVFNEVMYHHPPNDPEPAVTTRLTPVLIASDWRYDDSGTDRGTVWREPAFDDTAWPDGDGVFAFNASGLPAAINTPLAPDPGTCYFRTTFNFTGTTSNLTLSLQSIVDDGAVFYLNGIEFHRQNMPTGTINHSTEAASPVGDASFVDSLEMPPDALLQGLNVLAVEVHQAGAGSVSSGIVLSGGGLSLVEEGPFNGTPPPNLARQPGVTPFAIDSLAGFPIHNIANLNDGQYGNSFSWIGNSGSPGYCGLRFGGEFEVGGIAFGRDNLGQFTDRTLGLFTLQFTQVASPGTGTAFTGNPATGWATIGTLNYQSAGGGLFTSPSRRHRFSFNPVEATGIRLLVPATGIGGGTCIDELEVNPPDNSGDIAFATELSLITTLTPARPFSDSEEEWIELHNRSSNPVDLANWTIEGTASCLFPTGTVIEPNGYLVAARQPGPLIDKWPEAAALILGGLQGRMTEHEPLILRDNNNNPVDQITIPDAGFSDGNGSSAELIDPNADNRHHEVWRGSHEGGNSQWQNISYRMIASQNYGSTTWNEFRLGLLDAGEVLVDDVSVIRDPDGAAQELIQNGGFDITTGNVRWRWLGSHGGSRIVTDPDNPSNPVLRISSVAPARSSHNHVETSYAANTPIADGQLYEVSFRARWMGGTPLLNSLSYHQKLARTTVLSLPPRLGTPGAPNSTRIANAGPTFSRLQHTPIVPPANAPVTITVEAHDPDTINSITLHYRINPATTFSTLPMTLNPDGLFEAIIPGQTAGKVVQFHVTATDAPGATTHAPEAGPDSRALYQVADNQGNNLPSHELRIIQLDIDRDSMHRPTNVMSQARLGGTLVYNGSEVFYNVGVRLKGSAAGRIRDGDDYPGYDIRFPSGHLFRGVHSSIAIDRSARAPAVRQQHEIFILHMFQRAGLPVHHSDLCHFIAPKTAHTGPAILQLGGYNNRFVNEQFGRDGSVFNFDITYEPSTTDNGQFEGIKLPVPHQGHHRTDFQDLGDDKEQYRVPFSLRTGERRDDYSGIIRLCKVMGSTQPAFDAGIAQALNVDQALRVTALTLLCGIGDIYFAGGLEHNLRVFTPADGGPAEFLPWDMDFVFTSPADSTILPGHNVSKFMNHNGTRRRYYSHVLDLLDNVFNATYMTPWLASYGAVAGQNYTSSGSYIASRGNFARSQLPAQVPFTITSNGGNDFLTTTPTITIAGNAWINVWQIALEGANAPLTLSHPSTTTWQTELPLLLGTNVLTFIAYDRQTNILALDSITVTTTATGGGTDSDGDGLPDDWEQSHGLDPHVDDAGLDGDLDGLTHLEEYLSGTDPFDPGSFLRIDATSDQGMITLHFRAAAGRSYTVLSRDNPGSGPWSTVTDVMAGLQDREIELTVPAAGFEQFYRLTTPTQPQ